MLWWDIIQDNVLIISRDDKDEGQGGGSTAGSLSQRAWECHEGRERSTETVSVGNDRCEQELERKERKKNAFKSRKEEK